MQFLIAFFVGTGAATWVYTKIIRSTGGNVKSTLIVSVISGLGAFFVTYLLALSFL
jgi:hypothetical protein